MVAYDKELKSRLHQVMLLLSFTHLVRTEETCLANFHFSGIIKDLQARLPKLVNTVCPPLLKNLFMVRLRH